VTMALSSTAIRLGAGNWTILGCIQVHAFYFAPTLSIASTIILARLTDAKKEFGPIRATAAVGWSDGRMDGWTVGCLLVKALGRMSQLSRATVAR